jgi:hypothetical protein
MAMAETVEKEIEGGEVQRRPEERSHRPGIETQAQVLTILRDNPGIPLEPQIEQRRPHGPNGQANHRACDLASNHSYSGFWREKGLGHDVPL